MRWFSVVLRIGAPLQIAFAPTPASVEDIAEHLPANIRAAIMWFPQELRAAFIDPLRTAPPGRFQEVFDHTAVAAIQLLLRLFLSLDGITKHLSEGACQRILEEQDRERARHEHIARRLEQVDVDASDALRTAYEWLRVVLTATTIDLREELTDPSNEMELLSRLTEDELRFELAGEAGAFLRGMLLTVGALDLVLEDRPIPPHISEWCHLALHEMQSCASSLRTRGVVIPFEVAIPGFTPESWRARRRAREATRRASSRLFKLLPRNGPCPPGVLERIVDELNPEEIWLFGSRARGTSHEESDWDLLVVLPDATPVPTDRADLWRRFRDLARLRLDIHVLSRRDFDADRNALGTLAQIATSEGQRIHGR